MSDDLREVQQRCAARASEQVTSNAPTLLGPDRHPQQDFFIANLVDAAPKDDVASMEHALYSLSKKPDTEKRVFERITVTPSVLGRATIWDKDIILFCIAQMTQRMNDGETPQRTLRFQTRDLLVFCNRGVGGTDYDLLIEALDRLAGTLIKTDIRPGGKRIREGFGLLKYRLIERTARSGKPASLEIDLCEWLYNAVVASEVLTINRDYFRLTGGLERRVYSIARKHCGRQPLWEIGVRRLFEKSGSTGTLKKFRLRMNRIATKNALPDYTVSVDAERDMAIFRPRDPAQRRTQMLNRRSASTGY